MFPPKAKLNFQLSVLCLLPALLSGCNDAAPERTALGLTGCDSAMLAGPSAADEREYSVPPGIADREAALNAVEGLYPADLRASGTGGTAMVDFLIDTTGAVAQSRLATSSGFERIDSAAVAAARHFQFTPAYSGRERACIWMTLPVRFDPQA